jgi:hypothetical protein
VGRWQAAQTRPAPQTVAEMARLVKPLDAALALDLVRTHNAMSAPEMRVEETPFLSKAAAAGMPEEHLVDAVVCAACEAVDLTPKTI